MKVSDCCDTGGSYLECFECGREIEWRVVRKAVLAKAGVKSLARALLAALMVGRPDALAWMDAEKALKKAVEGQGWT